MDRYTDGIREAAFEYGIKKLAYALDMSESRLYKKLDPDGSVSLTLTDFFRINRILGDVRCVQAALDDLGVLATPVVHDAQDALEAEIQELLLDQQEQAARFMAVVREARKDGKISAEELVDIRKERRALAESGNTILHRIERWHESGLRLAKG